jgi:pyruvate kinase
MNVVRINSAHATPEGAQKIVDNVREVSDKIAILIDTKGPEVRLTKMEETDGIDVRQGDTIYICDDTDGISGKEALYTNCKTFVNDVPTGSRILIDDGSVELLVRSKTSERLECVVRNSGVIKGKKSINVPNVHISLPSLTEKDKVFVKWAIDNDIDFIAHSFVRTQNDILDIQKILDEHNSHIKLIAKIENQQGIDNLKEILIHSYGVMIARGDLGVEIAAEKIPLLQKSIVQMCREYRKPVIIATQMLHSMIENPRPTRAEVTDIANAIFQRTDAIMLSGETASGKYPVESVTTMRKIASEVEDSMDISIDIKLDETLKPIAATLARNLVEATMQLPVKAIIFDTWTGRTGRYLAEFRPRVPVYAMCYQDFTVREMALTYGIYPYKFDIQPSKEEMVKNALKILITDGKLSHGDLVGFIGGSFNDALGASYMEFKYV